MKTVIAVGAALGASLLLNYSMYLQKKAVDKLPTVKLELSWTVFKAFATNLPWLLAFGLSLLGGGLYAIAIAIAPISIVQPIVGSGIALLAYLAIKNLGERPRRIDIYAIGLNILGVILVGVSLMEGLPKQLKHDPVVLWIFAGVVVFLAVVIPLLMRGGSGNRLAAGLGISVGLLFGIAAIFARLLLVDWTNRWPDKGLMVLFSSVFLVAWGVTLIPGFIAMQAALQRGMAVIVAPLVAGLGQVVPILGGMIALKEPFPKSVALSVVRMVGFGLLLVGTIILSRRAEETGPEKKAAGQ